MTFYREYATIFLLTFSCTIAFGSIVNSMDDQPSQFRITTKRTDDKVEIKIEDGKTSLSIRSPFGISQAVIERTEDKWHHPVVMRLQLKGLENLRITNDKVTLEAAVTSHTEKPRVRLWKDKKEDELLDSKSPYWMEIRSIGSDGKPTNVIQLKDGYFEMQLPKAFLEDNPKSITVHWVDFYR